MGRTRTLDWLFYGVRPGSGKRDKTSTHAPSIYAIIAPPQVGSTRLLASLNSCLCDPICVLGLGMSYFYFITSRACHYPLCLNPSKLFGVNQGQAGGATSAFASHPAV